MSVTPLVSPASDGPRPGSRSSGERLLFVDGLRGLAASWVVLFHADAGGHIPDLARALPGWLYRPIFQLGGAGIAIFFAVSGFVISHSLRARTIDAKFFGRFTLRRAARLDPPYFASIVVFLAFALLSAKVKHEPFEPPAVGRLLAHLFYLQNILGYAPIDIIYWTLCLEIQFYLVYCASEGLAQRLSRRSGGRAAALLVFGPLAVVALLWGTGTIAALPWPGLFVSHWHGFLLGVFAHWAYTKRAPAYVFWAFAAILLGASRTSFNLVCVLTASALVLAGRLGTFGSWMSARPWQTLGRVSYSLYLTHGPVTGASFFVLYALAGKRLVTEAIALPLVLVACVAVAAGFWWLVERPCLALSHKLALGTRPREPERVRASARAVV